MINCICLKRSFEYCVVMMVIIMKFEIFKIIFILVNFLYLLYFFLFYYGWLNVVIVYSVWFWSFNENKMCWSFLYWICGGNGDLVLVMFWVEIFFFFKIGIVELILKFKVYILLLIYLVLKCILFFGKVICI